MFSVFKRAAAVAGPAAPIERWDTGQAYRVALWTVRVLAVIACAEGLVIVFLAAAVMSLLPLKEVVPMLLTTGTKQDQIVRVEPFEIGMHGFDILAETMTRRYVELRETIDLQTEVRRWQEVAVLSSPDVFGEFRALMGRENKNSPFERMKAERITRAVNIIAVNVVYPPHPAEPAAVYQVEFETVDYRLTQEIERRRWVASLSVEYQPRAVRYEDRYVNPIGFQVVGYSVAKKEGR